MSPSLRASGASGPSGSMTFSACEKTTQVEQGESDRKQHQPRDRAHAHRQQHPAERERRDDQEAGRQEQERPGERAAHDGEGL